MKLDFIFQSDPILLKIALTFFLNFANELQSTDFLNRNKLGFFYVLKKLSIFTDIDFFYK